MNDRDVKLSAYLDGELDPAAAAEIEALLARDPDAAARLRDLRQVTEFLRAAYAENLDAMAGPPQSPAARSAGRAAIRRTRIGAALALAAAVVLAVLAFDAGRRFGAAGLSGRAELVDEIAGYHRVFARETTHLVEIPADRSDELVAWFGDRLGRPLVIPDLSARGYAFAGGRLLVIADKPVAQLFYTRPGALALGICLTPGHDDDRSLRYDYRSDLSLVSWTDALSTWVVVGDLPEAATRTIAAEITRQSGV